MRDPKQDRTAGREDGCSLHLPVIGDCPWSEQKEAVAGVEEDCQSDPSEKG
ncbi:hypothetical protein AAAY25_01000 [Brotaphodocola catenula]|uniref:Uncharacterized protein n=1 Tax=Brotaphodocola catenula TaxID=2885361 RepID=A0AAE3APV5_9FIRM|nr:hypothetical protein [Brotaphodocola catenula]MCC2165658.1 hypothetical protein [Brotaphodocola catenula]